jgi:hypothetical protein
MDEVVMQKRPIISEAMVALSQSTVAPEAAESTRLAAAAGFRETPVGAVIVLRDTESAASPLGGRSHIHQRICEVAIQFALRVTYDLAEA